jgi:NAD(P)-dependent dehydrogenase (short-subunit alcohol dehydrogenase family)
MVTFDFTGKTILITGASYGLGEAFALALAKAGAGLILTARSAELLEAVATACRAAGSPKVTVVPGDVSVEADVQRVVNTGIAEHGKIDGLVNNAGISDLRGLAPEQFDLATFNQIIAVDLVGAFLFARECGKHMLTNKSGSIVNICSIMASGGSDTNLAPYAAAKGGLLNLTKQLGTEWADRGVRVNAISPGFIVTEMTRAPLEGMGMTKWIASRTPMRRVGEIPEIVSPVLFLLSDASSYVTGIDFLVDGGTNAVNGAQQIMPIHHEWNAATPRVPGGYEGLVPRPDWIEVMKDGIPGIHYPVPGAAQ